ncbi:hypothetical protein HDE78_000161 [Rhodanobacter sp. K2T2]|nr:hypothetical protein [Rhodanobacter sp. K2T2]
MLVMGLYCHFYRQKRRSVAGAVDRAIYAAATGLEHRSVADGQRVAGIYQRDIMLANGRYAMLDDDMGFFLVPWRPVIEQRLGQQLAATVRGGWVLWNIGRQRGLAIG